MNASPILPGSVIWSGENPIVSLKLDPQGDELTNVTFFRIVYSPAGGGHAAFISTRSFGGLFEAYTDNRPLGVWLRDEVLPSYPHYATKPVSTIPLKTATFGSEGDARKAWLERIVADGRVIELAWSDLTTPFIVDNPGGSTGKAPYHVISLFVPARRATLTIDGKAAEGRPFPRDIAGTQSSTCFLAFSETWLTLPDRSR